MGIRSLQLGKAAIAATLSPDASSTVIHFAEDGVVIPNGLHLVCTDDTYDVRKQVTFKVRPSTYDAKSGSFSKAKQSVSIAIPTVLLDGKTTFTTLRIEIEAHPSIGASVFNELCNYGSELMLDPNYKDFWVLGAKN